LRQLEDRLADLTGSRHRKEKPAGSAGKRAPRRKKKTTKSDTSRHG